MQSKVILIWIIYHAVIVALGIAALVLMIHNTNHIMHKLCLSDIRSVKLMSVDTIACDDIMHSFHTSKITSILLLSLLLLGVILGSLILFKYLKRSQEQESFLLASLIKQKETIKQAERKSMNKSLAFARASHDIRNSLAAITGLIEICRADVPLYSELNRNLSQMNDCAKKLHGILNSVLDISKMEEGKLQLEEVEFDMAQVLEESVDIFHVVALRKGIEIIWDPCDFSVLESSNVRGDCMRFKEILDNLLSNAVKFTSAGYVVVRAWSKKPSLKISKLPSSKHGHKFPFISGFLSRWLCKDRNAHSEGKTPNPVQPDPNLVEFIFEVDDTGLGIPKEKRAVVFEDYNQVKESSTSGIEGTGLGLGIVQSYVRLMGGEINIQDKGHGERGTCFRFNILLKSSEMSSDSVDEEENSCRNQMSTQPLPLFTGNLMKIGSNLRAKAFKKGVKVEGSHSMLLVEGEMTNIILERWFSSLGMKVYTFSQLDDIWSAVQNILCTNCTPENSKQSSGNIKSCILDIENDDYPNLNDENDQTSPFYVKDVTRKASATNLITNILLVIDVSCGDLSDICSSLKNFTEGAQCYRYMVIWLVNSNTHDAELQRIKQAPCDLILQKPFHGSRLYAALRLLQEFEGRFNRRPSKLRTGETSQDTTKCSSLSSSVRTSNVVCNPPAAPHSVDPVQKEPASSSDKPLSGMGILLVDDASTMRYIVSKILVRLGATVEQAENGLEALNLVKRALQEGTHDLSARTIKNFPYNVIFMDCEMPIMNGCEATKNIRAEEKPYGIHIPIIALSGHESMEEKQKAKLSGMDFHLSKTSATHPKMLLQAIDSCCQQCGEEIASDGGVQIHDSSC